jgi:type IV pilus assembly protein PilN
VIRINLIAGDRRAAKAAGLSLQIGQKITLAGSVVLLVTALLVGWRYWALTQQETQLAADIDAARREEARLAEVLKQVASFESQRGQLQERVTLIDELRRGQSAPVHLVDEISRSVPEMTWLTSLKQDGYDVTIQGRSTTLAALSDFVGNLEATRYFRRPVEIVETQVVKGQDEGQDLISFTIRGTFQMAGLETSPAAKTGSTSAPKSPAKGANVG